MKPHKEFKKSDLVEIVFTDPTEFDTNYDDRCDPIECRTIGWIDEQNSSFINIVWLAEGFEKPYVGLSIPRGCIKKIQPLMSVNPLCSLRGTKN